MQPLPLDLSIFPHLTPQGTMLYQRMLAEWNLFRTNPDLYPDILPQLVNPNDNLYDSMQALAALHTTIFIGLTFDLKIKRTVWKEINNG